MPGRQAHGRSLAAAPKAKKGGKHSKARSQKNALNAFGIAQDIVPEKVKKTPRYRGLIEGGPERKHGRAQDDEDEDEDDEEEQPQRKKARMPARPGNDDAEFGSDSEGNEWQLGGMAEDDNDSEIDSDEAFGDSDNEKFDEYKFRKTKVQQGREDSDSEGDSSDAEGETLGDEAIDLATALDQWEEDSEEEPEQGSESGSEDSGAESDSESGSSDEDSDQDDFEDADPERLESLRGLVSGFGGEDDGKKKDKTATKQKIDLGDLGLTGLDDPHMKNSVKLMKKEDKEKRPGSTKKLDAPLSRREQGRNDRFAAYEQTNKNLDRWTDTVKQNRRAEHLVFPLPENSASAGLDNTEIQPLRPQNATSELESTILSLMDQSGLSMEKQQKKKEPVYDEEGNELTKKEVLNRKRLERELNDREAKRAARIKKIKSKAYHRVHRKQKERNDAAIRQEMEENGEIDSEEERQDQDRRRALERVGQKYKDSKWAKMGARNKRAVWDDDFRAGLADMARRDEELRRRKEGKQTLDPDDETSSSGSDSDADGDDALARKLEQLRDEEDEPQSKLMSMKFMRNAEAARRKENDELINDTLRELRGEDGDEEETVTEIGRRQYGGGQRPFKAALDTSARKSKTNREVDEAGDGAPTSASLAGGLKQNLGSGNAWSAPQTSNSTGNTTGGAWSNAPAPRKKKSSSSARVDDLDVEASAMVASRGKQAKPKKASASNGHAQQDERDSDDELDDHMPMAIRDQKLLEKAFAGDDTMEQFEREKEEVAEADDDKVVDNTMPGWGSWVGDGVSKRELDRHKGRFLTKVEGIKKKNRQDAKLDKVIINEKQNKKNNRYLASQLPHPFETREQYERSLRLPVGPEWQTKETFQDGTKPRVLIKQGTVITPISKPSI